jgi:hypothetical protein
MYQYYLIALIINNRAIQAAVMLIAAFSKFSHGFMKGSSLCSHRAKTWHIFAS